jgi:hypothetical protein
MADVILSAEAGISFFATISRLALGPTQRPLQRVSRSIPGAFTGQSPQTIAKAIGYWGRDETSVLKYI